MSTTNYYNFQKADVGASENSWGTTINSCVDLIDSTIKSVSDAIPTTVTSLTGSLGTASQIVRVNAGATSLEFHTLSFLDCTDTPSSLSGQGGKTLQVNSGATAIEFVTPSSGLSLSNFSVTTGSASGGGSLSYNNSTGAFSFAPASVPSTSGLLETTNLMTEYKNGAWTGSQIGVGGYAILAPTGSAVSTTYAPGATLAGTSLRYSGIITNDSSGHQAQAVLGSTLSYGTWRCMGNRECSTNNSSGYDLFVACLWLRTI